MHIQNVKKCENVKFYLVNFFHGFETKRMMAKLNTQILIIQR